ncbi:SMP-30/gluconolactonase/LRE family protein [Rhodococcus sp. X156]|uniref:SMP-30/gluconolactonase/LRE family protein n=1 Tax=Rhodococcus sp. X156 TaxID=2499145 RepID=UPI000FDCB94E|nr:SMP-30/gluconolactonase/LRE family protein [Rhodococcus sp. X156]
MELADAVAQAREVPAQKVASGYSWTEIPRWHDDTFWFGDMYNHQVLRQGSDGGFEVVLDVSDRKALGAQPGAGPVDEEVVLGGMGWLPDGRLVVTSMYERVVLVWDGQSVDLYADLREVAVGPVNDMVVDADGRAYVTQLGFDMLHGEDARNSALLVVEPDGSVRALSELGELASGNGITITADGTRVVVAEVLANCLTVLDRGPDGALSNRRVFAPTPWLPDGICLDAQGGVWTAMPGSGVVARFVEGGEMTDAITLPMEEAMGVACVLGGADRSRLYVCAGMEVFDRDKSRAEGQGSIWTAKTTYSAGTSRP